MQPNATTAQMDPKSTMSPVFGFGGGTSATSGVFTVMLCVTGIGSSLVVLVRVFVTVTTGIVRPLIG